MVANPLVTVIVTTYNRKNLLKETIDSILNQSFTNFELIVVDNFSNYNFFKHIGSFNDERIKPFQNQNNGIIAVNRNIGIKQAQGEYISFCDDDDKWYKSKLEKSIKLFFSDTTIDLVSHSVYKTIGGKIGSKWPTIKIEPNSDIYKQLLFNGNSIGLSTVTVKKNIIEEINGFNQSPEYLTCEDYDAWLNLAKLGKVFYHINEPLAESEVGGYQFNNYAVKCENTEILFEKHYYKYPQKNIITSFYYYYRLLKLKLKRFRLYFTKKAI
jgi:glycosyltransferase involved in cell wall biosynthesis